MDSPTEDLEDNSNKTHTIQLSDKDYQEFCRYKLGNIRNYIRRSPRIKNVPHMCRLTVAQKKDIIQRLSTIANHVNIFERLDHSLMCKEEICKCRIDIRI